MPPASEARSPLFEPPKPKNEDRGAASEILVYEDLDISPILGGAVVSQFYRSGKTDDFFQNLFAAPQPPKPYANPFFNKIQTPARHCYRAQLRQRGEW